MERNSETWGYVERRGEARSDVGMAGGVLVCGQRCEREERCREGEKPGKGMTGDRKAEKVRDTSKRKAGEESLRKECWVEGKGRERERRENIERRVGRR